MTSRWVRSQKRFHVVEGTHTGQQSLHPVAAGLPDFTGRGGVHLRGAGVTGNPSVITSSSMVPSVSRSPQQSVDSSKSSPFNATCPAQRRKQIPWAPQDGTVDRLDSGTDNPKIAIGGGSDHALLRVDADDAWFLVGNLNRKHQRIELAIRRKFTFGTVITGKHGRHAQDPCRSGRKLSSILQLRAGK